VRRWHRKEERVTEVWMKRCLLCGRLNGPLATKCEHCSGSGFEWMEKDKPPAFVSPAPPARTRGVDRGMNQYWTHSDLCLSGQMNSKIDRLLTTIERFLIEGRDGGVSPEEALHSARHLRSAIRKETAKGRWYHKRIVKMKAVPGAKFFSEPLVIDAEKELLREVEVEIDAYFRSHGPCLRLVDSFCTYRRDGLMVMVAATLYGPGSIREEVLREQIDTGGRME
jgi:ribosomal protein L40E